MATTTSTTKAKTKKTKKPAAKAAVKTTKKTETKKSSVTKKAPVKKQAVTTKVEKPVSKASVKSTRGSSFVAVLQREQMFFAGIFAALAVFAGYFMANNSVQVFMGHLAKDELASRAGTVLAPAAHAVYEVEFRWLLVALLGVSALIAVLRGTRFNARNQAGIKNRVQPLRWADFAITGSFAFAIVALLNGLQDAWALNFGIASIVLAAILAWMFEREHAVTGKPSRALYAASAVAVSIPVIGLFVTAYATYLYGMVRSPWYAYAAAFAVSIGLLLTVRMTWTTFKKYGSTHNYALIDRKYNTISVVSKVALAVILITGLYAS